MMISQRIRRLALFATFGASVLGVYAIVDRVLARDAAALPPAALPAPVVEKLPTPEHSPQPHAAVYLGAKQCQLCHGVEIKDHDEFISQRNEYSIWKASDVHAHAGQSLQSDGKHGLIDRMNENLGQAYGVKDYRAANDVRCLNCHAAGEPAALAGDAANRELDPLASGVSCEACHGPSDRWIKEHHATRLFKQRKTIADMVDVRDPRAKAELCSSCHIGDAAKGRFVTHEMYAAGHPPLPGFEVSGFQNIMPAHWTTLSKKPANYREQYSQDGIDDSAAKQALIGGLVGLKAYLDLLAASQPLVPLAADGEKVAAGANSGGPELALYDCYSCHHDLQKESWRQSRGYPHGKPGRPMIRPFPLALARVAAEQLGAAEQLEQSLAPVYESLNAVPFGKPATLSAAAKSAAAAIGTMLNGANHSLTAKGDLLSQQVLLTVCKAAVEKPLDYESTRQLAWTVMLIQRQLAATNGRWNDERIKAGIATLSQQFSLEPREQPQSIQATSSANLKRLNDFEKLTAPAAQPPPVEATRASATATFKMLLQQFEALAANSPPAK